MIEKLLKVNDHLENIVRNSGEHCHFCKIMNITQDPFEQKSFDEGITTFEFDGKSIELVPEWLKKLGKIKLCKECFEDTG